jgi:hypothetical protein
MKFYALYGKIDVNTIECKPWFENVFYKVACRRCNTVLQQHWCEPIDVEFRSTQRSSSLTGINKKVPLAFSVAGTGIDVLHLRLVEAFGLANMDCSLGNVMCDGVVLSDYRSVMPGPGMRIDIEPVTVIDGFKHCVECGRRGFAMMWQDGYYVLERDILNRRVCADRLGGLRYVTEDVLKSMPPDTRSKFNVDNVEVRVS